MALLSYSDFLYQCRIYDGSGNLVGLYDDLISLQYRKVVNGIGMAVLTVPETHAIISQLVDDLLLNVYFTYRPQSGGEITDQQDFVGLYRDKQIATDSDGNVHYLLYFMGSIEVLSRNIVAYPSGTNLRSQFTTRAIATISKEVVQYNCTSLATTGNSRLRNANVVRGLDATLGSGRDPTTSTINYSCAYRNVLEVVQELAQLGVYDFDVVFDKASYGNNLYYLQYDLLGTDRSTTLIFDLNLDNIQGANLNGERLKEKTVAIVGGQGQGSSRTTVIRTGTNQSASNDYEIFVDARSNTSTELNSIGDAKMTELEARTSIDVDIAPSSGYVYRRDYGLGDLVTVSFADTLVVKKINVVEVAFDQDQNVKIRIELVDA